MISSLFRWLWRFLMEASDRAYSIVLFVVLGMVCYLALGHFIDLARFERTANVFFIIMMSLGFIGLCRNVARVRAERLAAEDEKEID